MIIVGAKGFAKEVLEVFAQSGRLSNLAFYDDISTDASEKLYGQFPILRNQHDTIIYMREHGNEFCIGVGNPYLRKNLAEKMLEMGGILCSAISPLSIIGHFGVSIGQGASILTGTIIENDVVIDRGVLINLNCTVGHDSHIGAFAEIGPGVNIPGHCKIGDFVSIGTGAVLIPGINIGNGSVVAAGSVVTKNVPDKVLVAGVPSSFKKNI